MPFEFIQIPANGQGSAKEELNKLLRGGRIASVRKEFVPNGEDSFWAFCEPQQRPDELEQQHRVPGCAQLRPSVPDGSFLSKGLNRPPSCSSRPSPDDKTHEVPLGAGRPAEAGSKAPGGAAVLPLLFPRPHPLLFPH
jgi:hypothetical protein